MSKRSKRTGGEWTSDPEGLVAVSIEGGDGSVVCDVHGASNDPRQEANSRTIALAGTTANKLDALGWDGDACIEALPEIMDLIAFYASHPSEKGAVALLSRLRPAKEGGGE